MSVPAVDKIPSYATIPEQPAVIPIRPPEFARASARSIRRSIEQALSSQYHSHRSRSGPRPVPSPLSKIQRLGFGYLDSRTQGLETKYGLDIRQGRRPLWLPSASGRFAGPCPWIGALSRSSLRGMHSETPSSAPAPLKYWTQSTHRYPVQQQRHMSTQHR